ncbi:MAG: hypothetical protein LBQ59_01680 [Candidatus Peribacteria bacterium]|jgi:uncharacterized lipoprotein NlpE involved in copper resistance|nr:hypothetical protein [Candidatus Peribacteria bacterium]
MKKAILAFMLIIGAIFLSGCNNDKDIIIVEEVIPQSSVAVIGVADNSDAVLSIQDGAYYYDYGQIKQAELVPNYPLAFGVNIPKDEISEIQTEIVSNNAFSIDNTSEYLQGELFTIVPTENMNVGNHSAVIKIFGTKTNGENFEVTFVAVLEVIL